ncbi:hypothetical protein ACFWWC_08750 [Streptomyces sp. NPDC058642]|uniref:hypothetical protein n=1 Tax=Streptomyces sp. NPDC058642 TaxID=3346572 RepID=UPI00364C9CAF
MHTDGTLTEVRAPSPYTVNTTPATLTVGVDSDRRSVAEGRAPTAGSRPSGAG